MRALQSWWRERNPQSRKTLVSAGVLGMLGIVLYLFMNAGPESSATGRVQSKVDRNVLTGSNPKALGLDALGTKVREVETNIGQSQRKLDKYQEQTERSLGEINDSVEALRNSIDQLHRDTRSRFGNIEQTQRQDLFDLKRDLSRSQPAAGVDASAGAQEAPKPGTIDEAEARETGLFEDAPGSRDPARQTGPNRVIDQSGARALSGEIATEAQVQVYGDAPADTDAKQAGENEGMLYIPAGSILSGVLITGVDAPTALQSKRDPMPALVRIKHDAILPNRFRADVKECFLIVGTTGDLSTERAFMRGESFSCVRHDGAVIETTIDSYVVGEDGKAGMRGRLVSRNGSLIAKSMAAGFLSAVSEIYRPTAIQGLNTSPGSETLFQRPDTASALEAGGYAGFADAMDRLAQYFLDLADEIHPFIEVDAGRRLDSVLLGGVKLNIGLGDKRS